MKRFTVAELQKIPTIRSGQFDELKLEFTSPKKVRVWLSRLTERGEDLYANQVVVEELVNGLWIVVESYRG